MFITGPHAQSVAELEAIGTPVAIWERGQNQQLQLLSANALYEPILSVSAIQALHQSAEKILVAELRKRVVRALEQCLSEHCNIEDELKLEHRGQTYWWRFIYSPVKINGVVNRVMNTCIDISEKKALELSLETSMKRFEAVIDSAYDGIISIDQEQNIKLFNRAAAHMFGLSSEQAVGSSLERFIPHRYRPNHGDHLRGFEKSKTKSRPMHTRASVHGLRQDGSEFPLEITISKINVGDKTEMTAVLRDISERAKLIEDLRQAASIDPLTGISNRRHFHELLQKESLRCQRFGHSMVVVMIDLDNFKHINDSHGHAYGDKILKSVVTQVHSQMREVDSLSRWGGDEFIALLPEMDLSTAQQWAESVREFVGQSQQQYYQSGVTLSIGLGVSDGSESSEDLLARIDRLLYQAKAAGRNSVIC